MSPPFSHRPDNTGRKCAFCDLPATAPGCSDGTISDTPAEVAVKAAGDAAREEPVAEEEEEEVMVARNLKGKDDIGLGDAPHAGLRSGTFELGARRRDWKTET